MAMQAIAVPAADERERFEAAASASRRLADSCCAGWSSIAQSCEASPQTANLIMDCSYVASAAARMLAHADEHALRDVAMLVEVARGLAKRIAQTCWEHPRPVVLLACAGAARGAIESYDAIAGLLRH